MAQKRGGIVDKEMVLSELNAGRKGAIRVLTQTKISSDQYRAAYRLVQAIDDVVELLTGDREYFYLKPSIAPTETQR